MGACARRTTAKRVGPTCCSSARPAAICSNWSRSPAPGKAWAASGSASTRATCASLLADEEVVVAYGPTNRDIRNLFRNLWLAQRTVRRLRPRTIVTTGAGVAVPFAWLGRLRGAKVVYVESFTRIDSISLSCRLIKPVADRVYVQWPDALPPREGGTVRGERLLRRRMIVVSVGTNEARFDRLLEWVSKAGVAEELVVQHGPSVFAPKERRASRTCRSTPSSGWFAGAGSS